MKFIVDTDGQIINPGIQGKNDTTSLNSLERAALQFIKKMPQWVPGMCNGKVVATEIVRPLATTQTLLNYITMISFNDITPAGYARYVEVDLGAAKMILISGQVAMDDKRNIVGEGNFEQQAEFIFSSIKDILKKTGGSLDNIVKLNNYLTDISDLPLFKIVRDRYVNTLQPPASTTVGGNRLVRNELLLEIEATAIINKS